MSKEKMTHEEFMKSGQGLTKEEWEDFWKNKCETCIHFRGTVFDTEVETLYGFYPIVVGQWDGYCMIKQDLFPDRVKNLDSCQHYKVKK